MLKNFRLNIVLRVIFLLTSLILLVYLTLNTKRIFSITALIGLVVYQTFSLIKYTEKANKELQRFFDSITFSDYSQTFSSTGIGASFTGLGDVMNKVMNELKKTRNEKEENYRYLQTIVEHIGIGLITFDNSGDVYLINHAAKKLLHLREIKNIITLSSISVPLVETLFNIKAGQKSLIKVVEENELLQLSIYATEFKAKQNFYKLVSITNIQSELEEREMEAWQNLIRVLTHEIVNSVAPISSLARTVNGILNNNELLNGDNLEDTKLAMYTIENRTDGLLHFVNSYRSLTKIPKPNYEIIAVQDLFLQVNNLFNKEIEKEQIKFINKILPQTLELTIDRDLIVQVLINLIKNSIDALKNVEKPEIELIAKLDNGGRPVIKVADNGVGILEEVQEKSLYPFSLQNQRAPGSD